MSNELKNNIYYYYVPEKYRDKVFLSVNDLKDIFDVGQTLTYDYLNSDNLPFKITRINSKILINAYSFWQWYFVEK